MYSCQEPPQSEIQVFARCLLPNSQIKGTNSDGPPFLEKVLARFLEISSRRKVKM